MKKIFTFLVTALIGLVAFNASANFDLKLSASANNCVTTMVLGSSPVTLTTTPTSYTFGGFVATFEVNNAKFIGLKDLDTDTMLDNGYTVQSQSDTYTTFQIQAFALQPILSHSFQIVVEASAAPKPTKEITMYATEDDCVTFTQNGVEYTLTTTPTKYPLYTEFFDFEVKDAELKQVLEYEGMYGDDKSYTSLGDNKYQMYAGTLWPSATYEFVVEKSAADLDFEGVMVVGANEGDTQHFTVQANGVDVVLNDGKYGPFPYIYSNSIVFRAKEGYQLTSVVDQAGKEFCNYARDVLYLWESDLPQDRENHLITVTLLDLNAARTASFEVTVDGDSSDVHLRRNHGNFGYIDLTSDATTTIKFNPETETSYQLSNYSYKSFYKVEMNGVAVPFEGGSYNFEVKNGDKLLVVPEFPDIPATVNIEGNTEAISQITVNNMFVNVTDIIKSGKIECKLGDAIYIYYKTSDYTIDEILLNGEDKGVVSTSFNVTEENYILKISATLNNPKNITVTASDYENVSVYKDKVDELNLLTLTGDMTELQIPKSINTIVVVAPEGWNLTSVLFDGAEVLKDGKAQQVELPNIADGSTIIIKNEKDVEEALLIVYNQPAPEGESQSDYFPYYNLSGLMNESIPGYTEYNVPMDAYYYVELMGKVAAHVYMNGEPVELTMGMAGQIQITEQTSVLKVFYDEPAEYRVKFHIPDNVDMTVITDRNASAAEDVVDMQSLSVFQGTELNFTLVDKARAAHEVKVNSMVVNPNEDGVYTVIVNDNTSIDIDGVGTGINAIGSEKVSEETIFNLQGLRINKNVNELPAGIYVINGKKIVKK